MFHQGGIYCLYFKDIKLFLKLYTNPNDVKSGLQWAFQEDLTAVDLHVLGVIRKLLTWSWICTFYTPEMSKRDVSHLWSS